MRQWISDIKKNSIRYGSLPFWSWNDRLEEQELRRQIRRMHELGMNGFFMHARGGLETEYLSDEWYALTRACVDEARKLGMEAWAYDENGWPSGFAGGKLLEDEKNHAVFLTCENTDVFPTDGDVLGVYTLAQGVPTLVTAPQSAPYVVIRMGRDASYVDTLDAEITKKFIEQTHEQYKQRVGFSENMPGFFTDEPQYYRYRTPWSRKLPAEFERAYGYSVLSVLPALFMDFEGAEELRYDYYLLCHRLFITNFIKVIYDWCEANGCMLTGHAVEERSLSAQMWCCGGVMPFYEYEHIPGIDYLSRRIDHDLAAKQLGSACAQLGKKKALSEMFGCCGWDVTPRELKRIAEIQYVNGVNLMCQHLYPYSERGQRKTDYPAHYSEHLPWQDAMRDFNTYFNHLGYTLSRGEELVTTLIVHPMHSAYLHYKRKEDDASIRRLEDETLAISNLFSSHQIPYHWGDETMMARHAHVEGDTLCVGLCRYRFVVIPYCETLDSSTVALLRQYVAGGGRLFIASDVPTRIDGKRADLSFLTASCTFEEIRAASPVSLSRGEADLSALRMQIRKTERGRIVYITNPTKQSFTDVRVDIRGGVSFCELDMLTLTPHAVRGENGALLLNFASGESHVLFESDEYPMLPLTPTPAQTESLRLPDTWRFVTRPENAMTLDYVSVSYDGVHYEKREPLTAVKNRLYEMRYRGELWLRYEFDIDELPDTLSVAAEPLRYTGVSVNGTSVALTDTPWFDKSFLTADILPYVTKGRNEITLSVRYFQRDYVYYVLYGDVSESLRNCLWFDTELENIYLFGDFALRTDRSRFVYGIKNSVCYDGAFAVCRPCDEIRPYDLVTEGYPFFAGSVTLCTEYTHTSGGPTRLTLDGRYATARIRLNGVDAGELLFSESIDLAGLLREGKNEITVTLTGSNRNLMGPHHRPDPEPYGVSPSSFSYENEWKRGVYEKNHLDRYAFVRFGFR
ncbi:MAG: hypothetical protein IJV98_07755 [Clostridia bacterium]|nr:hypothetical protein [Clostridia bacterium]